MEGNFAADAAVRRVVGTFCGEGERKLLGIEVTAVDKALLCGIVGDGARDGARD